MAEEHAARNTLGLEGSSHAVTGSRGMRRHTAGAGAGAAPAFADDKPVTRGAPAPVGTVGASAPH
jgi:hypothetical protein